MPYRLRDNLYHCVTGGRTIFLDVDADRYFALPANSHSAFQRQIDGAVVDDNDRTSLQPLIARGLLIPRPNPLGDVTPRQLPGAGQDMGLKHGARASRTICLSVAAAQLSAMMLVRTRSLASIKRHVAGRRRRIGAQARQGSNKEISEIAAGFDALDSFLGRGDRCLVRSLAFLSLCWRRQFSPFLVFGVQANPFSAHCWVQQEDVVLNDALENVRPFSPIMIL